jgi:NADH dehydrogenase/NADH:ubiquinone oxidoreductase subunit G
MVEISHPKWEGWTDNVVSCVYPVRDDGLVVKTDTPRVRQFRASVLDLLIARCPGSPELRELGKEYGLVETNYIEREDSNNCILCGLCARVCDEVIGVNAISTAGRGYMKDIMMPLDEPPPDCIGCGACAFVCPTNVIDVVQAPNHRIIWEKTFDMKVCPECGSANITLDQANYMIKTKDLPADYYDLCDECKRKKISVTQKNLAQYSQQLLDEIREGVKSNETTGH